MSSQSALNTVHACREACGACCIAPSISSPIPGMREGKPAGVRCIQLDADLRCAIFGDPQRPACCSGLKYSAQMCGTERGHALAWLTQLEIDTQPDVQPTRPGVVEVPTSSLENPA